MKKLKLVLPTGSLQKSTLELFEKAGIKIYVDERSYEPSSDEPEVEFSMLRAQEIPRPVEMGIFDCGITGYDWICENEVDVEEICELVYSKSGFRPVRWVVATKDERIKSIKDLNGKTVATELKNVSADFFKRNGVNVDIKTSWGTTEKLASFYSAIVELTETGKTLERHGLRILDTVLVSTPRFIANKNSWKDTWKRMKMENIAILLKAGLSAYNMVGLKMNVERKKLNKILKLLPALKKPTISPLTLKGWVAIEVVLDEKKARELIPELTRHGAQGIIEYPLNKVVV